VAIWSPLFLCSGELMPFIFCKLLVKTNFIPTMILSKGIKIFIFASVFLLASCHSLVLDNPENSSTIEDFFSNDEDILSYAGSAFRTLHNAMQEYDGPALPMGVMADQNTCSWGMVGVKDLSSEPRMGFINSTSYSYYPLVRDFWINCYQSVSVANDLLNFSAEINEGSANWDIDTEMLKAWGYFISGVAHGYLGLTYDKANIVSENPENNSLEYVPWQRMIDYSLELLDRSIDLAESIPFEIPMEWMGGETYTNTELAELASSYAARILSYSSRNRKHNTAIDWNRVLNYAKNGIKKDLAPVMGDAYDFYDYYLVYSIYPGWERIDHRIINLMDPDYPSRWPMDGVSWTTPDRKDPGEASSVDARLASDFQYLESNEFRPDRGYYHFSHYRLKRYDDFISRVWYGDIPHASFLVWENKLLIAEAQLRLGNASAALAILNDPAGTRKVRGNLPDLNTTDAEEIFWTIFYERDVELINTGMGISYFDMRRRDMLQRGTILHFPVPAGELMITRDEVYTIGGIPDSENVSNGSWTGLDGLTSPIQ